MTRITHTKEERIMRQLDKAAKLLASATVSLEIFAPLMSTTMLACVAARTAIAANHADAACNVVDRVTAHRKGSK